MRLLIDLGNTRLKWAQSEPGDWRSGAVAYRGRAVDELLDDAWATFAKPALVAMVSVGESSVRHAIEQWVSQRWSLSVQIAKPQPQQLGVVNRYRDPHALGADRWVALVEARAEQQGSAVCVVSCGTAVTVDALTANGEFVGGVILPGLGLARESLQRGTAGVRFDEGDETSCLARSTADAVAAGTLYGLVGAVERICDEFSQALNEVPKIVITGGDADRIAPLLRRSARRVPDLVLRGLDRIYSQS